MVDENFVIAFAGGKVSTNMTGMSERMKVDS